MTPWHLGWQQLCAARPGWSVETLNIDDSGEYHWADATTPSGQVIEFQHSPIQRAEVRARQVAHSGPLWIVDATNAGVLSDPHASASDVDVEFTWPNSPPWVVTLLEEAGRVVVDMGTDLLSVGPPTGSPAGAVFSGIRVGQGSELLATLDRCQPRWSTAEFTRFATHCPKRWIDTLLDGEVTPTEAGLWLDGCGRVDGLYRVHQLCNSSGYPVPHPDRKGSYTGHYGSWLDRVATGTDQRASPDRWFEHYGAHTHLIANGVPPAIASLWDGRHPDVAILAERHCVSHSTSLHTLNRSNKPAMQALKDLDYSLRYMLRSTNTNAVTGSALQQQVDAWAHAWLT